MTIEDVKKFFKENKDQTDVKAYLESLTVDVNIVKAFLETNEEGKKLLQSLTDSKVTQGIETFKKNNLDKLVEAKYNELHPAETPEQKRIRDLEQKFNESEKEKQLALLRNKALTMLTAKGFKPEVLEILMLGEDETTLTTNIDKLSTYLNSAIKEAVTLKFKEHGREERNNEEEGFRGANPWKAESFNLTQQAKLLKELKPDAVKQLKAAAGYKD